MKRKELFGQPINQFDYIMDAYNALIHEPLTKVKLYEGDAPMCSASSCFIQRRRCVFLYNRLSFIYKYLSHLSLSLISLFFDQIRTLLLQYRGQIV